MTVSTSTKLVGSLGNASKGGVKIVNGLITLEPSAEAVHAEDLGLKTIQYLDIQPGTQIAASGTVNLVNVYVAAPGSYGNYASVNWMTVDVNTTGTAKAAVPSGALTNAPYLAIGF